MQVQALLNEAEKHMHKGQIGKANQKCMQVYQCLQKNNALQQNQQLIRIIAYKLSQNNSELAQFYFDLYFRVSTLQSHSNEQQYQSQNSNADKNYWKDNNMVRQNYVSIRNKQIKENKEVSTKKKIKHSETHWVFGSYLYKRKKNLLAEKHFKLALKDNPNKSQYIYSYCLLLKQMGQYEQAYELTKTIFKNIQKQQKQRSIQQIRQEHPQFESYFLLGIQLATILTNYQQVTRFYELLVQIWGQVNYSHYFDYGQVYKTIEEYDKAHQCYEKAIILERKAVSNVRQYNPYHYLMNACVLQKSGKLKQAITNYRMVLEIMPEDMETARNLGVLLAKTGEKEKASALFDQCLEIDPNNTQNCYNYTLILLMDNNIKQAMKFLDNKVKANPQNIELLSLYAACLGEYMNQWGISKKIYKHCLILNPKNMKIQHSYAKCLMESGEKQKAWQQFKLLIKTLQKNNTSYGRNDELINAKNSYSIFLMSIGQYKNSKIIFQELFFQDQDNPLTEYNYALLLSNMNKKKQAKQYFRRARQLSPQNPLFLLLSGVNFYELGNLQEAELCFRQANRLLSLKNVDIIQQKGDKLKLNQSSFGLKQWQIKFIKQNLGYYNQMIDEYGILKSSTIYKKNKNKHKRDDKFLTDAEQQQQINKISYDFVTMLGNVNKPKIQKQRWQIQMQNMKNVFMKEIQALRQQNATLHRQVTQKVLSLESDVCMLKEELLWSKKLDARLNQLRDTKKMRSLAYGKKLCWMLCVSVQAFRALKLGIVGAGDNVILSKTGGFVQKISQACDLVSDFPVIGNVCGIISKFSAVCVEQQQNIVIQKIIQATDNLYHETMVAKASSQTVQFLLEDNRHIQMLQNPKPPQWFERTMDSVLQKKDQIVQAFLQIDLKQEQKQALLDCGMIIAKIVKMRNPEVANNVLKIAATAVLQQKIQEEEKLQQEYKTNQNKLVNGNSINTPNTNNLNINMNGNISNPSQLNTISYMNSNNSTNGIDRKIKPNHYNQMKINQDHINVQQRQFQDRQIMVNTNSNESPSFNAKDNLSSILPDLKAMQISTKDNDDKINNNRQGNPIGNMNINANNNNDKGSYLSNKNTNKTAHSLSTNNGINLPNNTSAQKPPQNIMGKNPTQIPQNIKAPQTSAGCCTGGQGCLIM